ncbi:hypothetical protein LABALGLTS371_15890 [Dellaglioa algida]|uniref:DUF771 domain-containing protein n=1 Tax=Dellaglioa algida TaxID=105612 RepID=A0A5C6M5X0_9LACO|nr:DUF771 domain-containing protein [Dellaglioa algida]MDK1716378.1 DUF771 domain-containing protein [Dellaglioa algida]MDK1720268.1 DUF771 domain-containing protein [Dellaglioa algida]MDK1721319.1 DUF771 domain-containing protein [Dellaglioa algida]TWW10180.1 hypothetical protein LABALGLTS371_15890 [Dellaglioa algida]
MKQTIKFTTEVVIPPDKILIDSSEYEELLSDQLAGRWWNLKEVKQRTGHDANWLKDNILLVPKFRKQLDAENGGPVFYPGISGRDYQFEPVQFGKFLEVWFPVIFKELKSK